MRASRLRKKSKMCFVASPAYLCDSAEASERLLARGLAPQAKPFREKHLASPIPYSGVAVIDRHPPAPLCFL